MNGQTLNEQITAWRAVAGEAWRSRSPRDRAALAIMALVLGAFVVWTLAIAPAWRTLQSAPAQIEALDAQLLQMRGMAAEARELRSTTPIAAAQAGVAMKAAAERHGDKVRLTLQGDRALVTFNGASPEQLRALLVEARSAARARPVEAQLTRGANGFNGTLVLSLGAG
ncbi:MAG: type II secretion system protein GspM [Burkholderiaceae bacterium]